VRKPPQPHPSQPPEAPPPWGGPEEPPPLTDEQVDAGSSSQGWDALPVAGGTLEPPSTKPRSRIKRRLNNRSTPARPKQPETPWERFCTALKQADARFEVLTKAVHLEDGKRLRLILPAGRPLAEATRVSGDPAVAAALEASYPAGTELALEASRSGRIDRAQLEREFLADPALRRIVQTLGATIERVEPHTPPSEEEA